MLAFYDLGIRDSPSLRQVGPMEPFDFQWNPVPDNPLDFTAYNGDQHRDHLLQPRTPL